MAAPPIAPSFQFDMPQLIMSEILSLLSQCTFERAYRKLSWGGSRASHCAITGVLPNVSPPPLMCPVYLDRHNQTTSKGITNNWKAFKMDDDIAILLGPSPCPGGAK